MASVGGQSREGNDPARIRPGRGVGTAPRASPTPKGPAVGPVGGFAGGGPPTLTTIPSPSATTDPPPLPPPPATAGDPPPGLVICATTRRVSASPPATDTDAALARLWQTAFPGRSRVDAAAAQFASRPWLHAPGKIPRMIVGPGVVRFEAVDLDRRFATEQRTRRARERDREWRDLFGSAERDPTRRVLEWSAKSRARMVCVLAELDYSPLVGRGRSPCMITLTLPGDWLTVAPDGAALKAMLSKFRQRWARAWGEPLACVWKLEFQRRGAPHVHLFTSIPLLATAGELRQLGQRRRRAVGDGLPLRPWLSLVWADIVDHPDPVERGLHERAGTNVDPVDVLRYTDPKRVAVYFTKHGTFAAKDYQNVVPPEWREPGKGPGRFWGVWELERTTATVNLAGAAELVTLVRTTRRWARAQSRAAGTVSRRRVRRGRRFRTVARTPVRLRAGAGFVCVNDGPALAVALARVVAAARPP